MNTADAILDTLRSVNVPDSNLEAANVVDVIAHLADATRLVAGAIRPLGAGAGADAAGGTVASLTEATMGITAGLFRIAESIETLAQAIVQRHEGTP